MPTPACRSGTRAIWSTGSRWAMPSPGTWARSGRRTSSSTAAATTSISRPAPARRRSNFVVWADSIKGPWSEPIDIGLGGLHRPGPRGGRRRQALPVPQRRRLRAAGRRRAERGRHAQACVRRLEVPGKLGRGGLRAGRPEDQFPRWLVLHDHRRGRHRRPADRAHGDHRALALDPRPVGECARTTRSCAPGRPPSRGGRAAMPR